MPESVKCKWLFETVRDLSLKLFTQSLSFWSYIKANQCFTHKKKNNSREKKTWKDNKNWMMKHRSKGERVWWIALEDEGERLIIRVKMRVEEEFDGQLQKETTPWRESGEENGWQLMRLDALCAASTTPPLPSLLSSFFQLHLHRWSASSGRGLSAGRVQHKMRREIRGSGLEGRGESNIPPRSGGVSHWGFQ